MKAAINLGSRQQMVRAGAPLCLSGGGEASVPLAYMVIGVTFVAYLVGQLVVGTSLIVAAWFSLAILFGLLSVQAAGGVRTALGVLNLILIGKFLLLTIAMKMLTAEPSEKNLYAAETTAVVMAVGFLAVFLGTSIQRSLPQIRQVLPSEVPNISLLILAAIIFTAGCLGAIYNIRVQMGAGSVVNSGGLLGIARQFGALKAFSVVPAMLYLWRTGRKQYLSHPAILAMVAGCSILGLFGAQKAEAMEPSFYAALMVAARYGFRSRRFLGVAAAGLLLFLGFVYPYSQYARSHGVRQGDTDNRLLAIREIAPRLLFDPDFRNQVDFDIRTTETQCWDAWALLPLSRFAMVCPADRLIAVTDQLDSRTGWETITWGFKLLAPSFLYPNKPAFGTGNYLAHITGQLESGDQTTQVSFGLMANFYNAFRLPGVFIGTLVFFIAAYYWLTVLFGNPQFSGKPSVSVMFFLFLIGTYQHGLPENSFASLLPGMIVVPLLFSGLLVASAFIVGPRGGAAKLNRGLRRRPL